MCMHASRDNVCPISHLDLTHPPHHLEPSYNVCSDSRMAPELTHPGHTASCSTVCQISSAYQRPSPIRLLTCPISLCRLSVSSPGLLISASPIRLLDWPISLLVWPPLAAEVHAVLQSCPPPPAHWGILPHTRPRRHSFYGSLVQGRSALHSRASRQACVLFRLGPQSHGLPFVPSAWRQGWTGKSARHVAPEDLGRICITACTTKSRSPPAQR
mmetsp:Transcript_21912/g.37464  ORF Transcript_21912/g.37464 Transcript_21912/m.37464 type:complete len:214 (-) Transcript_21912:428-1069(-)